MTGDCQHCQTGTEGEALIKKCVSRLSVYRAYHAMMYAALVLISGIRYVLS